MDRKEEIVRKVKENHLDGYLMALGLILIGYFTLKGRARTIAMFATVFASAVFAGVRQAHAIHLADLIKDYLRSAKENKRYWKMPLFALCWNEIVYYLGRIIAHRKVHYDLTTPIDAAIPLVSWTVLIYFGCFAVWAVAYLYIATGEKKEALRFFVAEALGKAICLFFFLVFPTTNVRPEIVGAGFFDYVLRLLYFIDQPNNLFPSIHVMVSWYCYIGFRNRKDCPEVFTDFMLLSAVAVCISTLTTRQHVLADIAGAILFAELAYLIAGKLVDWYETRTQEKLKEV